VRTLEGRVIKEGTAKGEALVVRDAMGWLGCVDPVSGTVIEKGHPLEGLSLKGKVLVFKTGKGSTVGSYTIYALKKNGVAPAALVCKESEPIVAVGAIISDIPMVDLIDTDEFENGMMVTVQGSKVTIG